MELTLGLLVIGIVLLLIEIYLTPGATIFGIIGLGFFLAADFFAIKALDNPWSWLFVLGSTVLLVLLLYSAFKVLNSKKVSLQSSITSKVNVLADDIAEVGEQGKTITDLRPNGRALFTDRKLEVFSLGDFVKSGTDVEVVKVTSEKIFVKPTN